MTGNAISDAIERFGTTGGVLRTSQALAQGIHPATLYQLRDQGLITEISRGVYRLSSLPPLAFPDLVTVAARVPRAVFCLLTALAYYEITTEVAHEVYIALPRGTKTPKLDWPPLRVHRFSGRPLTEGVEVVRLDGVEARIYSAEKTVADCFRFRNKLGLDVAIEALDLCIQRKGATPATLLKAARICRVDKVMLPYLQARR